MTVYPLIVLGLHSWQFHRVEKKSSACIYLHGPNSNRPQRFRLYTDTARCVDWILSVDERKKRIKSRRHHKNEYDAGWLETEVKRPCLDVAMTLVLAAIKPSHTTHAEKSRRNGMEWHYWHARTQYKVRHHIEMDGCTADAYTWHYARL